MTHFRSPVTAPEAGESRPPSRLFRAGWWVLVVITALLALNHTLGTLTFATSDDERAMFMIFLALNLLSLVVLVIPYRRRERWSWGAMWIPVVTNAIPLLVFSFDEIAAFYASLAVLMAAGQLTTLREFRAPPGT